MRQNIQQPQLTDRDIAILVMIYCYGGCVIEHIQQRFFISPGARSACYARIARLVEVGLLKMVRLPSRTGVGSGRAFLTLGLAAYKLVAVYLKLSQGDMRRFRGESSPLFMAHHLAICSFRLALEMAAERHSQLSLQEWISERELKRVPVKVRDPAGGAFIVLVPDGSFTLARNGAEQPFNLEMDMATIAPKRLRLKLRSYLAHRGSLSAPVLFVVPTQPRQAAIAQWAAAEAHRLAADPTIFWLTTSDKISQSTILTSPIWQVVGGPARLALDGSVGGMGQ